MCILNILLLSHPEQGHLLRSGKDIKIYKILKLVEKFLKYTFMLLQRGGPVQEAEVRNALGSQ